VIGGSPTSATADVDLSKAVTVSGPGTAERVTLSLSAAGIPLGTAEGAARPSNGGFSAELTFPAITRWIVGGAVTATVSGAGEPKVFTLRAGQYPLASALGAGSLILALFALAYLESGLRTIRNGFRWGAGPVAAPVLGLLFGTSSWLCVSVLRSHEPLIGYGVPCAALGAIAATCILIATRKRRTRPAS
jgi:serine/threonine-protein kinase